MRSGRAPTRCAVTEGRRRGATVWPVIVTVRRFGLGAARGGVRPSAQAVAALLGRRACVGSGSGSSQSGVVAATLSSRFSERGRATWSGSVRRRRAALSCIGLFLLPTGLADGLALKELRYAASYGDSPRPTWPSGFPRVPRRCGRGTSALQKRGGE